MQTQNFGSKREESNRRAKVVAFQDIEMIEIDDVHQKIFWVNLFRRDYKGGLDKFNSSQIGPTTRFFVAKSHGVDLGYIKTADSTSIYSEVYAGPVLTISEVYVLPQHRHKGVAHAMISKILVKEPSIKRLSIQTHRYKKRKKYFESLGFSFRHSNPGTDMSYAFMGSFKKIAKSKLKLVTSRRMNSN